MSGNFVLYGGQGTGAVAVEAALVLAGQAYELVDVPDAQTLGRLLPQMRQVPRLILPDGQAMTESEAILIRLAELLPHAGLAPAIDDPARGQFLRWMSFVATQVYAHFWLKDDPSRLVPDASLHSQVSRRIEARITDCWAVMERETTGFAAAGPWILGQGPTVLDAYVAVVSRFRPRRRRFYAAAPRLGEAVRRLDADPRLSRLWDERYPFFDGWEDD
ncbi:glutathione S-transferase family protein [Phenylobacterium sp.]|jgi:GST-like protein|uniref:glutathione S-transferase family protein n=1 Tax=Phenylobacterium sp. TaxID=1871053 RepID=UPI002F430219